MSVHTSDGGNTHLLNVQSLRSHQLEIDAAVTPNVHSADRHMPPACSTFDHEQCGTVVQYHIIWWLFFVILLWCWLLLPSTTVLLLYVLSIKTCAGVVSRGTHGPFFFIHRNSDMSCKIGTCGFQKRTARATTSTFTSKTYIWMSCKRTGCCSTKGLRYGSLACFFCEERRGRRRRQPMLTGNSLSLAWEPFTPGSFVWSPLLLDAAVGLLVQDKFKNPMVEAGQFYLQYKLSSEQYPINIELSERAQALAAFKKFAALKQVHTCAVGT